jgi:hypothetical protein
MHPPWLSCLGFELWKYNDGTDLLRKKIRPVDNFTTDYCQFLTLETFPLVTHTDCV